jgi:hypothetical protein
MRATSTEHHDALWWWNKLKKKKILTLHTWLLHKSLSVGEDGENIVTRFIRTKGYLDLMTLALPCYKKINYYYIKIIIIWWQIFTNFFNSYLSPFGYILIMQIHTFLVYDICSGLDTIMHDTSVGLFKLSMVLRLKWSSLIKIRHGVKFWLMNFE